MQTVRVVVYGSSVMLAVLEAALRASPLLAVIRVDPNAGHAANLLQHFRPQIVIVDGNQPAPAIGPTRLLRIDQNANNQFALLNRQSYAIQQFTDLLELIVGQ